MKIEYANTKKSDKTPIEKSMYKVRCMSPGFDPSYSSCSNLKPKLFRWTTEKGEFDVHINDGIYHEIDASIPKNKRFGWLCESTVYFTGVYQFLVDNHKNLFEEKYNKIFTCDQSLLNTNPNFQYCYNGSNYPWVKESEWNIYHKTKICSMFDSGKRFTYGHLHRQTMAHFARELGSDIFGSMASHSGLYDTKIDGLRDYMFHIVVENAKYDSYWTEKLTDCFATGCVPIYWGAEDLLKQFDGNGIIRLEAGKERQILGGLTKDLYISKKKNIQNNFDVIRAMSLADDMLFTKMISYGTIKN
jgi:Glycosyltransferase family 10 (fucosyltransferase) C-term